MLSWRSSPKQCSCFLCNMVTAFAVPDLDAATAWLTSNGVSFERFPGFPHAVDGSVVSPHGARVVWLRDPGLTWGGFSPVRFQTVV
jgi:hypothetical protein